MRRSGVLVYALLALAAVALTACSEDEAPPPVIPSSAFPDDTGALPATTGATGSTGTTTPTGPTQATGALPTGATGVPTTGNLTSGQAAVSVSGDVNASKTMSKLFAGVYAPPPGGMAVVWTAGGADSTTLALGGLSFTGTQPTAATLSLTLNVQTGGRIFTFTSVAGECSVTIGVASASELSGAFTCSDLTGSGGEVVDTSGSFAAQG